MTGAANFMASIRLSKDQVLRVLTELCHLSLIDIAEGKNCWKALCCFHQEQTASLKLTEEGLFTCFGCGAEGGLADLVHKIQGTNHKKHAWFKILKHLGLSRDDSGVTPASSGKKKREPLPTLKQISEWQRNLLTNKEQLEYLEKKRGLQFETINKLFLGWCPQRAKDGGAIVLPFIDLDSKEVLKVRFHHPHRTKKEGRYTGQNGRNEVFPLRSLSKEGLTLFLEGEFDAYLIEQYGYHVFTTTNGVKGIVSWVRENTQAFAGCDIVLAFDHDEPGRLCAHQVAALLWQIAQRIRILAWPSENSVGTDPTDFLIRDGHSLDEFKSLIEAAREPSKEEIAEWKKDLAGEKVKQSQSLKDLIEELHWVEGQKGKYRTRNIEPAWLLEESVIQWFEKQGARFFRDRRGRVYLQYGKEIQEIGTGRQYRSLLWKVGRINSKTPEGRVVMEAVECHAEAHGTRIQSFSWMHFDTATWTLYVHLHDEQDQILRIAPGQIEILANGLNPYQVVLNPSLEMEPIHFDAHVDVAAAFRRWKELIYDSLATDTVSRSLIVAWSWVMWIRTLSQTKPILKLTGNMDTGKSLVGRLISTLIYGIDRASVGTTAANFSQAATEPLLFLDDLEMKSMGPAMNQFLKVMATGITKTKRQAGTESGVVVEHGDALVLITAIESLPAREVQSRTYEIEMKSEYKRQGFDGDAIRDDIKRCRSQILSAWFRLLSQHILPAIQDGTGQKYFEVFEKEQHSKYRTNKFFSLMLLVFNSIGECVPELKWVEGVSDFSLAGQWIIGQDKEDREAGTQSSIPLFFLNALLQELQHSDVLYKSHFMSSSEEELIMGKAKGFHLDGLAFYQNGSVSRDVVGFRATTADLFVAFSQLGKEKGRQFPIDTPRALGQRLSNDRQLIESAGWRTEEQGTVHGFQRYLWLRCKGKEYEVVAAKKSKNGELPF